MPSVVESSSGHAVIDAGQVRVASGSIRIHLPTAPAGPRAEVIRDGDAIVGVEVTCACGEKVRLAFDY
mgnify:CR=1 FL=1